MLKRGEEVKVMIIELDKDRERVSLGIKQLVMNPWDDIEKKYPVGEKISGKVVNLVPYGAFVEQEEDEGLIRHGDVRTKRINKPQEVLRIGEVEAVILGIQKEEKDILGMKQLEPNPWKKLLSISPSSRVQGKVRNLTSYGAFVELEEGIDGMVHVTDMSWTRKINHPGEVMNKGDQVDAIVLDVDTSQQRISLGLKQLTDDPWAEIEHHFKIGDIVEGKVA